MAKKEGDTFGEGTAKRTLVGGSDGRLRPSYTPEKPKKGCLVMILIVVLPICAALCLLAS